MEMGTSSAFDSGDPIPCVTPDEAAKHHNIHIKPQDEGWKKTHAFFVSLLQSDRTIQQIVSENLTYHDSRMFVPSDRADVKGLQAANTKRYEALLASSFKGVKDTLATKLTMMYFGLPAAPMVNPLEELAKDLGMHKPEPARYNARPPMHFLTAHDGRNWGKDGLKAKEAFNYPIPIAKTDEPTLGLRGGESNDTVCRDTPDYLPDHETSAVPRDGWVYLYGLNGCIPFVPSKWYSYATVLRQLLCIKPSSTTATKYSLLVFDRKTAKPKVIHDRLPLGSDSPAMAYLVQHFKDRLLNGHGKCCALFATHGWDEKDAWRPSWEPFREQFSTDMAKIGRSLGPAKNGPATEAISYAYLPFPKTKTDSFIIGKYGSEQFNAHFTATMEVLFGRPELSHYNHALFRLFDKNKPNASWKIPVIYGAMGLPLWAWELLHPLNNPDACWMVECSWLEPYVRPIILPNHYPHPNPYLVARKYRASAFFPEAYGQICEITSEALDLATWNKMKAVYVMEGDTTKAFDLSLDGPSGIEGWQIFPKRKYAGPTCPYGDDLRKKLQKLPTWYFALHISWEPGHCRLFPDWYSGGEVSEEMPPLTSELGSLWKAIDKLCARTQQHVNWRETRDHVLLKETPSVDSYQVPDMDSPSYLITLKSTEDDWLRLRQSITSPNITISLLKKAEADWVTCIPKSNIWGVRVDHRELGHFSEDDDELYAEGRVRWKREVLKINDMYDYRIDPAKNYPSEPVALDPVDNRYEIRVDEDGEIEPPMSQYRTEFFETPPEPQAGTQPATSTGGLRFPSTQTLHGPGQVVQEESQEYDVGVLATSRPKWDDGTWHLFGDDYTDSEEDETEEEDGDGDEDSQPQPAHVSFDDHRGNDNQDVDMEEDLSDESEPHVVNELPGPYTESPWKLKEPVGNDDRERTYTTQPSIFHDWQPRAWPSGTQIDMPAADVEIPLTAPPVEKILRTGSNVPMISKAILTPTEQAELQNAFWNVRNIVLKRTMICPFGGCNFTFRLDEKEAVEQHAQMAHRSRKCPWCEESLFEWWDNEQRDAHMREKHSDALKRILSLERQSHRQNIPRTPQRGETRDESSRQAQPALQSLRMTAQPNQTFGNMGNGMAGNQLYGDRSISGNVGRLLQIASDIRAIAQGGTIPTEQPPVFSHQPANATATSGSALGSRLVSLANLSHPQANRFVKNAPPIDDPFLTTAREQAIRNEAKATAAAAAAAAQSKIRAANFGPQPKKCAYFEKCGAYIGSMSQQQYRRHVRDSHGKEVQMLPSDDEQEEEEEEDEQQTDTEASTLRQPTPRPPPSQGSLSSRTTPTPTVTQVSSDTQVVNTGSNESSVTVAAASKTEHTIQKSVRKSRARNKNSEDELASDVASTVSRGRSSQRPRLSQSSITAASPADAHGSESKSSATQGRTRVAKKPRRGRTRDDDEEYEYSSDDTDDYEEEYDGVVVHRRRATSPDWAKKLGPEDPDFDPDDDMYCSKCLRKAPKRRSKSPNHSPVGREKEIESHTDKTRCCRIRNGLGSSEHLPNRSGWIRASSLPKKLGSIKAKFIHRYPTYARTIYPTNSADHFASIWRSDPNNEDNNRWWDIPWPPYEGHPPFPGTWEDPGPTSDVGSGKKRHSTWVGRQEKDKPYRYQSDSDSDESLKPDVDDIADLGHERGVKRRASEAVASQETSDDGPAVKKAKKDDIGKTPKRNKKTPGKPSVPSRASSRIRQKKASASPAGSAVVEE
ncbi:hypothetical protein F66182_2074 [Fusarium sp. NRRL 66182]|nr:hypothetical protein F66182_2074 [Fusarium sp. NRRL 66182]